MTDRRGVLLELARAVAPDQGVTVPAAWLLEALDTAPQGAQEPERSAEPVAASEGGDRLLTVEEVAQRLDVTPQWVYRHAKDLAFTRRLGRRTLRFSETGLRAYMARRAA